MAAAKQWQKLNWQDPFLLDLQLNDEQRMARDSVRAYAQDKLQPRVQNAFRKEEADPAIFREMGELPPPIPNDSTNLGPWTKSDFLAGTRVELPTR